MSSVLYFDMSDNNIHPDEPIWHERRKMSPTEKHLQDQINTIAIDVRTLREVQLQHSAATARVENNTSELIELINALKGAWKVLEGIGKLAKPVGYIIAASTAIGVGYHWLKEHIVALFK